MEEQVQPEQSTDVSTSAPAEVAPAAVDSSPAAPADNTRENDRIRTLNEEKNTAQNRVKELERQALEQQSGFQQHQPYPQNAERVQALPPVIDHETDASVDQIFDRKMQNDPNIRREREQRQKMEAEFTALKTQVTIDQFRKNIDGFADNEPAVEEEYGKLRDEGFQGPKMAELLVLGIRAKKGEFRQQGLDDAQNGQNMRLAAAAPEGGTRAPAPAPKSLENMTLEERDKLRRDNLHSAAMRTDKD